MAHPRLARLLMLGAATAALVVPAAAAPATAVSVHSSCAEVRLATPTAADGEYEITVFGQTLDVHCADMATSAPVEYLTLPNTGGAFNFSQGGPGSITSYTKLRLTLPSTAGDTFAVVPTDTRFSDNGWHQWGNAGSCGWFRSDANLDLRSTPFAMSTSSFQSSGWMGHSDGIIASSGGQVIDIVDGRGDCGGMQAVIPFALTWIASLPVASDPAGRTAVSGGAATFTASATGLPTPTVQWQTSTEGTTWADVTGATSTSLTRTGVTLADSGTLYRAVFTNNQGTVTTAAAELTVTPSAPSSTDPADTAVASGGDATFTVTVGGDPVPTVEWETLVDGVWTVITGATGAQLVLEDVTTAVDSTLYRAVATSPGGTVTTAAATLTVHPAPPVVTRAPVTQRVDTGGVVTFTVAATGDPAPTFQWQTSTDNLTWTDVVGATGTTFTLDDVAAARDGLWVRVRVANDGGAVASDGVRLVVVAPAASAAALSVSTLPATGAEIGRAVAASALLLLTGAAALLAARRRRLG